MNLVVLGPRVFIRPDQMPEMTSDGRLHLVHAQQQSTMTGTVVAIGDGPEAVARAASGALLAVAEQCSTDDAALADLLRSKAGEYTPEHAVAVGERVLFSPEAGEELVFERDLLVCMREDDILAVIE